MYSHDTPYSCIHMPVHCDLWSLRCEVAVLRRNARHQAKESNHVKLLAKQLLDQRTDVEDFFITALTEVKERAKHTQWVEGGVSTVQRVVCL